MDADQMLRETHRLAQENNKMLRAMRRNAFLGGIVRLVVWAALIILPIWFYMTYLAPVMESMMETYQQIQGTSAQAQAQFGQFSEMWEQFQNRFSPQE
ncbi:MAG TPA: hypothetical protein VJL39_02730 [Candidatus Paceibacterota bacterium]